MPYQVPIERRYPFVARVLAEGGTFGVSEAEYEEVLSEDQDFCSALNDGFIEVSCPSAVCYVRLTAKGRWASGRQTLLDRMVASAFAFIRGYRSLL